MEEDRRSPCLRSDISYTSGLDSWEIIVSKAWYYVLSGFNLARLLKFSCNSIATQMSFIVASVPTWKWQSQIQLMLQITCQAHLCPSAYYHHAASSNNPADTPEHTDTHTPTASPSSSPHLPSPWANMLQLQLAGRPEWKKDPASSLTRVLKSVRDKIMLIHCHFYRPP